MVWEGQVDGIAVLYIRGNRVDVRVEEGSPVARQRVRFDSPAPASRQDIRLEVIEGRGAVRIVDQPRLENDYTTAVRIEDRQSGSSFYSLAFYWDDSDRSFGRASGGSGLTWSGRVDDEVIVECRRNRCQSNARRGNAVLAENYRFGRPLPDGDVQVSLENARGRGDVRLIEQPSEANGYTTRILIRDPQPGIGEYSFNLRWDEPRRQFGRDDQRDQRDQRDIRDQRDQRDIRDPRDQRDQPDRQSGRRGLLWQGRVDGRVRVTVQGGAAFSEVVQGQPVQNERAGFDRPLPRRSDVTPTIQKRAGRGRVQIIETPSARNNYRLVFEIDDPEGGASDYQIEVTW